MSREDRVEMVKKHAIIWHEGTVRSIMGMRAEKDNRYAIDSFVDTRLNNKIKL